MAARAECVFSCLPHGASAAVVPALLDAGRRVVDFSADYRLNDAAVYEQWYGQKHADPARLGKVVYGLPELFRERHTRRPARGQSGLLSHVGHSGAGAAVEGGDDRSEDDHCRLKERRFGRRPHAEADNPLSRVQREHLGLQRRPASPPPEIDQILSMAAGARGRGRLHAPPGADGPRHPHDDLLAADRGRRERRETVLQTIRDFYADEPFVRVVDHFPGTKDSMGTNFCDITARVVRGRVLTFSCLDNLIKGASGAAVQNFNLMYGYPETTAL